MFEELEQLGRDWCWSVGRTRHTDFECRIWRRSQQDMKWNKKTRKIVCPGCICAGETFPEAIENAIKELKERYHVEDM